MKGPFLYLQFVRPEDISDKTIVVAPLDWGLGHATRCIPVIRGLLQRNCKIIFAGVDLQIKLIRKDFPEIDFEKIPGYEVSLDSQASTYRQVLAQFRGMKNMAKQEHQIANDLVKKYNADIVISDNRYGFYAADAYNIFITHQLNPVIPLFRKRIKRLIASFVNLFDCCWIPDKGDSPICGELTENNLNIPVIFIGWLSRFRKLECKQEIDVLIIVSGPEPERSRFQALMFDYFNDKKWSFKIVTPNPKMNDVFVVNPSSKQLETLINKSALIISRGGYTTIMELLALEKSAILIPTEGQYEQEYLAQNQKISTIRFLQLTECFDFMNNIYTIKNFV